MGIKKEIKPLLESIIHSMPNGLSKDFKVSKKNPSQDKIKLFTHKNPKTRFVSEEKYDDKDFHKGDKVKSKDGKDKGKIEKFRKEWGRYGNVWIYTVNGKQYEENELEFDK